MNPRVLILSGLYDFSTDLVTLQLQKLGVPFLRINREQLTDHLFTLDPVLKELSVDGPSGRYQVGSDLVSVWFRQPVFLRNTPSNPLSLEEQLERSQWTAFIRSLSLFRHAHWMNYPAATYVAESKPYQLMAAAQCGFTIPKTLATNDASTIGREFPQSLVIKSLDTVLLREGDDCLFTYTTIASGKQLRDEEVQKVPMIAQEYLENKVDLRVTIVGSSIFAVRILSQGVGVDGDWRKIPKECLEYQDIELDSDTEKSCRMLIEFLDLSFAAIDLIETQNDIFFIEVNPTGEWGWLSRDGRRIDVNIASHLKNGHWN